MRVGGLEWRRPIRLGVTVGCLVLVSAACLATAQQQETTTTEPPMLGGISGKNDGDHKPLWPMNGDDIATLILASLGLIVAAGGEYSYHLLLLICSHYHSRKTMTWSSRTSWPMKCLAMFRSSEGSSIESGLAGKVLRYP